MMHDEKKDLQKNIDEVKGFVEKCFFDKDNMADPDFKPQNDYYKGPLAKGLKEVMDHLVDLKPQVADAKLKEGFDKANVAVDFLNKECQVAIRGLLENHDLKGDDLNDHFNKAIRNLEAAKLPPPDAKLAGANPALANAINQLNRGIDKAVQDLKNLQKDKLLEEMEHLKRTIENQRVKNFPIRQIKKIKGGVAADTADIWRGVGDDVAEQALIAAKARGGVYVPDLADRLELFANSKATLFELPGDKSVKMRVKWNHDKTKIESVSPVPPVDIPKKFPATAADWKPFDDAWIKTFTFCSSKEKKTELTLTWDNPEAITADKEIERFLWNLERKVFLARDRVNNSVVIKLDQNVEDRLNELSANPKYLGLITTIKNGIGQVELKAQEKEAKEVEKTPDMVMGAIREEEEKEMVEEHKEVFRKHHVLIDHTDAFHEAEAKHARVIDFLIEDPLTRGAGIPARGDGRPHYGVMADLNIPNDEPEKSARIVEIADQLSERLEQVDRAILGIEARVSAGEKNVGDTVKTTLLPEINEELFDIQRRAALLQRYAHAAAPPFEDRANKILASSREAAGKLDAVEQAVAAKPILVRPH